MEINQIDEINKGDMPFTALLYCPTGVGKSTAIGLIAEAGKGKTLVLDIDRTIDRTLAKHEIVKDTSKVYTVKIDNINTFEDWSRTLQELVEMMIRALLKRVRTIIISSQIMRVGLLQIIDIMQLINVLNSAPVVL